MAKSKANRFGKPRLDALADHDAIDDGFDRMSLPRRKLRRLVDFQQFAVDPRPDEPSLADFLKRLAVLPLSAADNRCKDHYPSARWLGQNRFDDLLRRLRADRHAALMAARFAKPREKQPQIVVDLGDRGDRAARVVAAGPLIDGDRRLQALDEIDVRPFELVEELPGVGREAFDILPLPLGEDRVECQRTLA